MSRSDAALVLAARRGERDAFAALGERHRPALERACRRVLRDPHAGADATQESLLAALLGLERLRDPARFGSWLVGIGLNVSRRMLASRELPRASGLERPDPGPGPAELAELGWLAGHVRAAVADLPPGQRDAVLAFYLAGLTHAEAAEELGVAAGAIKTRLHKARRTLRTSLSDLRMEPIPMSPEAPVLVPMHIAELRRTTPTGAAEPRHVVFLEEQPGERRLLIWVGPAEATALAVLLERVELPRPTTLDLAAGLLAASGGRLSEVRIVRLAGNTFYAEVVLADGTAIDARPSDALALATRSGLPIRVDERVLAAASADDERFDDLRAEAFAAREDAATLAAETRERQARAEAEWASRQT